MLDSLRLQLGIRVCRRGLAALVLLMALPLTASAVAEAVLFSAAEKETTTKDGVECLAWASESRSPRQRSAITTERVNLADRRIASLREQRWPGSVVSNNCLPNGLGAPLRC